MFFRIYTTKDEYWQNNTLYDAVPSTDVSYNMRNCEFYPDEVKL
jgi:hypothetical protein